MIMSIIFQAYFQIPDFKHNTSQEMELYCAVQEYAWGKVGPKSQVAQLSKNRPDFELKPDTTYAELWMGTHPNGPSKIAGSSETLDAYIKSHPEVLGNSCREKFGNNLPFLFKILSVNKALSIQAHPNIELAKELHTSRPHIYKDANHKPEMAIALTEFEGLCGFRPLSEIQSHIINIPQLRHVVGENASKELLDSSSDSYDKALKTCFTKLMQCDKETIAKMFDELMEAIIEKNSRDELDNLYLRLSEQYPKDVGCFVIYFLNFVRLNPGEAMFLGPNVPHAYLSGDCVECMACSDNVVRAGLTPKLIDVDVLCGMLEYVCTEGEKSVKFPSNFENQNSLLYEAPVPDFSVAKLIVDNQYKSIPRESASIIICVQGTCNYNVNRDDTSCYATGKMEAGTVLFLGSKDQCKFEAKDPVVCYQAFC